MELSRINFMKNSVIDFICKIDDLETHFIDSFVTIII